MAPRRRLVALAGLTLLALAACAGPPRPSPGPAPDLVRSNYERATGDTVPRDCGYSAPLPSRPGWSLWLFCDTAVTSARGTRIDRLILGTDTAAAGPYQPGQVPTHLSELPTPPTPPVLPSDGAPEPFLPAPSGLVQPGGTLPCSGTGTYAAAWITGVAAEPAGRKLLISYNDYCVTGSASRDWAGSLGTDVPGRLTPEGSGLVEYDPASNQLGSPDQVFASPLGLSLPVQQVLGSPVFRGGYLYLFGFCSAATLPTGCATGKVFMVRVQATAAAWQNPASYQYWTGQCQSGQGQSGQGQSSRGQSSQGQSSQGQSSQGQSSRGQSSQGQPGQNQSSCWSLDPNTAASVLPSGHPLGVSAGDYSADGHQLVIVEQTSLAGDFAVWQARSPAGPWRRLRTGRVPCRAGTGHGAGELCRALIGHPELSTGRQLLISYYNPGNGHVGAAAWSW